MTEQRRKRIRGRRALQPLVLCGAMLAPALLAGGLLTAELERRDESSREAAAVAGSPGNGAVVVPVVMPSVRDGAFEPRLVPPFSGRRYEIRASRGGMDVRRSTAEIVPVDVPDTVRKDARRLPGTRTPGLPGTRTPGPAGVRTPGVRTPGPAGTRTPRLFGARVRTLGLAGIPRMRWMPPKHGRTLRFRCPVEWRETWLWKVCRERERREA
ncbi:hypothetical protein [Streptosporangium sp. NPDC087985]|uniref:hypothetical protein n=1 Tax=Streptosporangium sp. NPDC087985 TaxID=3366196 RepID=UPI0037F384BA